MKNSIRFRRGSVWFVNDNYESVGSIQGKSRPYVVVSNDACNRFSPVIHMAPLTTKQKKSSIPVHVCFINPRSGEENWVLVEQTMPKSVPDIANISNYLFEMSDETMDEIDKALAIQFALKSFGVDISDFETMLDMIVEQKIAQIQDATQSLLDARMSRYVDGLLNRVANAGKLPEPGEYIPNQVILQQMQYAPAEAFPKQDKDVDTPIPEVNLVNADSTRDTSKPSRSKSAIDRFNSKWDKSNKSTSVKEPDTEIKSTPEVIQVQRVEIVRTQHGMIRWSDALKRQFLDDVSCYGPNKVSQIWDLPVRTILAYKSRFAREFRGTVSTKVKKTSNVKKVRTPANESKYDDYDYTNFEKTMLDDYDSMPLSKFMLKYNIDSKAKAVEMIARLKVG